eukprot:887588-Pyramimonas_sp.AAC.1
MENGLRLTGTAGCIAAYFPAVGSCVKAKIPGGECLTVTKTRFVTILSKAYAAANRLSPTRSSRYL